MSQRRQKHPGKSQIAPRRDEGPNDCEQVGQAQAKGMGRKGPFKLSQRGAALISEGAGTAGPAPGLGRVGGGHEAGRRNAKIDDAKWKGAQGKEKLLGRCGGNAGKRDSGKITPNCAEEGKSSRRKVMHGIHLPNKI